MQFLRTIFWVILAVVVAYFAWANPQTAQVNLWGGIAWFPPMWFALLAAFLLGLLPVLVLHRATRWSLRRRLDTANRALAESQTATAPVTTLASTETSALLPAQGIV